MANCNDLRDRSRTKAKSTRIADSVKYYMMEKDPKITSIEHFKRKPYTVAGKEQI